MQLTLVKGVFCLKKHSFSVHKVPEFPPPPHFSKSPCFSSMVLFWIVFWKRIVKQIKKSQARKAQTPLDPLHQTEQILIFPEQLCFVPL